MTGLGPPERKQPLPKAPVWCYQICQAWGGGAVPWRSLPGEGSLKEQTLLGQCRMGGMVSVASSSPEEGKGQSSPRDGAARDVGGTSHPRC